MPETERLNYVGWIALGILYKFRDKPSCPARYVGLDSTIAALIHHNPPLAAWVGKASDHQVRITPEGIALYEADRGE